MNFLANTPHLSKHWLTTARSNRHLTSFMRFAVVGGCAFVIDVGLLHLFLRFGIFGPLLGRLFSYLPAAGFAWVMHRYFTFTKANKRQPLQQLVRYLVLNGLGGVLNYLIYALLVLKIKGIWLQHPEAAVVVGAGIAMFVNYWVAVSLIFPETASATVCGNVASQPTD